MTLNEANNPFTSITDGVMKSLLIFVDTGVGMIERKWSSALSAIVVRGPTREVSALSQTYVLISKASRLKPVVTYI